MESFALHSLSTSTSFSLSSPRISFLRRHSRPISKSHLSLSLNPNSSSIPSLKSTASHFSFFPSKSSLSSFNPLSKTHIVNQPIRGSSSSSSPSSPDAQGRDRERASSGENIDETKNLVDRSVGHKTKNRPSRESQEREKKKAKNGRDSEDQQVLSSLSAENKLHDHLLQTLPPNGVSDYGADERELETLPMEYWLKYLRNTKRSLPTRIEMVGAAYLSKVFTTKSSSHDDDDECDDNNDEIGKAIAYAVKAAKLMFLAEKLQDMALDKLRDSKKLFP